MGTVYVARFFYVNTLDNYLSNTLDTYFRVWYIIHVRQGGIYYEPKRFRYG